MNSSLFMNLFALLNAAMAMTTPSVPTSTEVMVQNMQFMNGQTGGTWDGINSRSQGHGISNLEAFQAIRRIYNFSIPSWINLAMTERMGGVNPLIDPRESNRGGRPMEKNWGGRNAVRDGGTANSGHTNGKMGRGGKGLMNTNSGVEWQSRGLGPMNSVRGGLNIRGMNTGMGWQGGIGNSGGFIPGGNRGMNIGMIPGMGGGGRRANVDKTIRTQATLNSQDGALLSKAGSGCVQDWTHVNGGVDPFCIRLLMMYPDMGM